MKTNEDPNKDAVERVAMLKMLNFRFKTTIDDDIENVSAYRRRGIELIYIPHSSVKVAKGFDDTI